MSANKLLFNNEILQQIEANKYVDYTSQKLAKKLEEEDTKSYKELLLLLLFWNQKKPKTYLKIKNIVKKTKEQLIKNDKRYFKSLDLKLKEFSNIEAKKADTTIKEVIPIPINTIVPKESILLGIIYKKPIEGKPLNIWRKNFTKSKLKKLDSIINIAYFENESSEQLKKRLIESGIKKGLTKITQVQARSLARTALIHSAHKTKDYYNELNKFIEKYRYTAILDLRTTYICASRDGNIYKDLNKPDLPAHFNCRSTYVPVITGENLFSEKQAITSTLTRKKMQKQFKINAEKSYISKLEDKKAFKKLDKKAKDVLIKKEKKSWIKENIGEVPIKTNFDSWFKSIPVDKQKDYLGKSRFALYKKGNLGLKDFVKPIKGEKYTLKELKKRNKEAFKLAKLL